MLSVGEGSQRDALLRTAVRLGVRERIELRRPLPQRELANVYAACDVLALTSLREGWPNVVLESLACGTPVVATDVGAVRQMLEVPAVGAAVAERDPQAIAAALRAVVGRADPAACRAPAARFGWEPVARELAQLIEREVAGSAPPHARAA